jgi:hypothetical protein
LRIVFDKNVPAGVRRFLSRHAVRTFADMQWHPQLENGELLKAAEAAGFDVLVMCEKNNAQNADAARRVPKHPRVTGISSVLLALLSGDAQYRVAMQDCNPLYGVDLGSIHNQVGVHGKEFHQLAGQIAPPMANARHAGQAFHLRE